MKYVCNVCGWVYDEDEQAIQLLEMTEEAHLQLRKIRLLYVQREHHDHHGQTSPVETGGYFHRGTFT